MIPADRGCQRFVVWFWLLSVLAAVGDTVRFSSASYVAAEGYSGNLVVVSRSGPTTAAARVEILFRYETASAGADFLLTNVAAFAEGEATAVLGLTVPADAIPEGTETAMLELANPSLGMALGEPRQARLTLHDQPTSVRIIRDADGFTESMTAQARWTVTRTGNPTIPFSLGFETQDITARAGEDYAATNGRIDFPAGVMSVSIEVPLINDAVTEARESFRLIVTNATPWVDVRLASIMGTVSIDDDDKGYSICCSPSTVPESAGSAPFTIFRTGSYDFISTVDYVVLPLSAEAGADYVPTSGTVRFGPGESEVEASVPLVNDAFLEVAQAFRVVLTNASHSLPIQTARGQVQFNILDNDLGFRFETSFIAFPETDSAAVLHVLRANDAAESMSVEYYTVGNTAEADVDFTPVMGTLSFPPGVSVQELHIPLIDDGLLEPYEAFRVVLTNASPGASVATASIATVTVTSDDPGFGTEGSEVIQVEESMGEVLLTVRRGSNLHGEQSVDYFTRPDTAAADEDYAPVAGTLVFGEFDQFKVIRIPILNDAVKERAESFRVLLDNPGAGTSLGFGSTRTVSIQASDQGFSFSTEGRVQVWEGSAEVQIPVERGSDTPGDLSVDYRVLPGTATPGEDYVAIAGTLRFGSDEAQKFINVPLLKDGRTEGLEEFRVELRNPSLGAVLGSRTYLQVVINDDDLGFGFATGGSGYAWESQEALDVQVRIFTDVPPAVPVSVDFVTVPVTATPGVDYQAVTGTLTFGPGETSRSIRIPLFDDTVAGTRKEFIVRLTNAVGLPLHEPASMIVQIADDERGYRIIGTDGQDGTMTVKETDGAVSLTVAREGDFDITSTVDYQVSQAGPRDSAAGTAIPGEDYETVSGTLTFGPGETQKQITLSLIDDRITEPTETLWIVLSNPTDGVPVADASRLVAIQDNERHPLHVDSSFVLGVPHGRRLEAEFAYGLELPVLPLADGRIIMTTPLWRLNGEDGVAVVRLLPTGQLDPSFSPAAIPLTQEAQSTGSDPAPRYARIGLNPGGGVLVGGPPEFLINGSAAHYVARLKADGSLDPSFRPRLLGRSAVAHLAALRDGSVLLAFEDYRMIRLRPDGSVDRGFRDPGLWEAIRQIAVDSMDRVLVLVGNQLRRLLPDGTLDERYLRNESFDLDQGFVVQPDDSVIIRHFGVPPGQTWSPAVARVTPSGTRDPAFDLTTPFGVERQAFVAPLPGGKLLAGWGMTDGSIWVSRHHPNGERDDSFTEGSYSVEVQADTWGASFAVVALETSGDLLLYGSGLRLMSANGQPALGVARLQINLPNPRIEVDTSSTQVLETNGVVNLTLLRTGDSAAPFAVRWETSDGTAVAGVDYQPGAGALHFGVGETEATIGIRLFDNAEPDRDRTLHLHFSTAEGIPLPKGTVTIHNEDLGFLPGGIRSFPNGRVLLEPTGDFGRTYLSVQRSQDLREWQDLPSIGIQPDRRFGVLDRDAPTGAPWFYRIVGDQ